MYIGGEFTMNIPERISALRALMAEKGYDAYVVPTDDNHQSEYVGEHFKARAFITGFTGSPILNSFTPLPLSCCSAWIK